MTSIYLTEEQSKKIDQYLESGKFKGKSDFVQRAIDIYILYLENPYEDLLLSELENWIESRRTITMFNMNRNMFGTSRNVPNSNINMLQNEANSNINMSEMNRNISETNINVTDKHIPNDEDMLLTKLKPELPMLKRILNNPENTETIPDYTLKVLSKRYDISKSIIQEWIVKNKTWLKNANFENE